MKIVYFVVPEICQDWAQANPPQELRRGELTLLDAIVTSKTEAETGKAHSFQISSSGGELTIAASKASQREEWLRALKCLSPPPHLLQSMTHFVSDTSMLPSSAPSDDDGHVLHMDSWSSNDSLDAHCSRNRRPVAVLHHIPEIRRKKRLDSGFMRAAKLSDAHVSPATSEEDESPRISDEHQVSITKPFVHRRSTDKRRLREMAMEANAHSTAQHEHLHRLAWKQRQLEQMAEHEQEILADWDHFGVKPTVYFL